MNSLRCIALYILLLHASSEGRLPGVLREVHRVYTASAPPAEAGGELHWGPRRMIGGADINGEGVPHAFQHCHPFLFLEDALLPRGRLAALPFLPSTLFLHLDVVLGTLSEVNLVCFRATSSRSDATVW